jgi:hypothetical protein
VKVRRVKNPLLVAGGLGMHRHLMAGVARHEPTKLTAADPDLYALHLLAKVLLPFPRDEHKHVELCQFGNKTLTERDAPSRLKSRVNTYSGNLFTGNNETFMSTMRSSCY